MANFQNHYLSPKSSLQGNKYIIERKISSGGFGAVYLARDVMERSVAIKEFLPSGIPCRTNPNDNAINIQSEEDKNNFSLGLEAFFQEADTVAKINNDKIIRIWDVFKDNGTAYFVMPIEQGESLYSYSMRQEKRISDEEIRRIFIDASIGLASLHEHNLLHLDLKPGNLWVRPNGNLVILDLGASRDKNNYLNLKPPARTPGYAAPEQHSRNKGGIKELSVRTDIYGMSATIYACIEKKSPIESVKRKENDIPYRYIRAGQVDDGLLRIIDDGLMLDPEARIQDANELRERLEKLPKLSSDSFKTFSLNKKIF